MSGSWVIAAAVFVALLIGAIEGMLGRLSWREYAHLKSPVEKA
jgi:hypothetical protein